MTPDLKISVVIAAYNAAGTIVESVQSCLSQTLPPYEIIVVDDGSTDGTPELLREKFGDRLRLLEVRDNAGPASARNTGVAICTGTHIAFQDADDTWHPEKLRIVTDVLRRFPAIRFLWHPYTLLPLLSLAENIAPRPTRFPFRALLWSNPIGTPCVIIHRDVIVPFDTAMRHMEDFDLFLRIGSSTALWMIRLPLTRLGRPILSAGGQSSSRWAMRRGELQAYAHLVREKPQYALLYPVLAGFALAKHFIKSFSPPRENY